MSNLNQLGVLRNKSMSCNSISCNGSIVSGNNSDVNNQIISRSSILLNNISTPNNGVNNSGLLWVDNNSPNQLIFTDDTGTDNVLSPSTGIPIIGSSLDNSIVRWNGTNGNSVQDSLISINDFGVMGNLRYGNLYSAFIESNTTDTTSSGVASTLSFNIVRFDTSPGSNMADIANNRIVIQLDGYYEVKGQIYWRDPNEGTDALYQTRLLGSEVLAQQSFSTIGTGEAGSTVSFFDFFTSGTNILLQAFQNSGVNQVVGSGGDLAFRNWLSVSYRGE